MPLSLSKRCDALAQAEIRAMSIECEKVGGINLAQGVCDTPAPAQVTDGVRDAFDNGENSYSRYDGLQILREAIAEKLKNHNGMKVDSEKEIVVSAGATGAFYSACLALLNPGDEVVVFEPYYGYHINTLLAVGAVPVFVRLEPPHWDFDVRDLEKVITPRTKSILLNTPGNPCGKIFSRDEIVRIGEVARRWDLFLITDEIYEYFVYDGQPHVSPGSIPGLEDRTISISGFSKTFSITGWRIGYSVAQERWSQMIGYMNDLVYVCAPTPLQHGVALGLNKIPSSFYLNLISEYKIKRDLLCRSLREMGMDPCVPQGAYYVLADLSRIPGKTGKDKAMTLLKSTGVACVPGEAFFRPGGRGHLFGRFCFGKTLDILTEACDRLTSFTGAFVAS